MGKIKIGKHLVEYYDSIDELPITRYHKFSKYMLIDSGIGSTVDSVDVHLQRISTYIAKGDKENALSEMQNLRHNIFMVQEELSPKHLAFVTLIKRIGGKTISIESESDIREIAQTLGSWPVGEMESTVQEVKKKIETECVTYFPEFFENAETKEYYDLLRRNTILRLKHLIAEEKEKEKIAEEIDKTDSELIVFSPPENFTGKDSAEIRMDKNFDATCISIAQSVHLDPKDFTTLRFYSVLSTLNEQAKKLNQKHKK